MKICRLAGVDVYLNPFFLGLLALFFIAGVLVKGLTAFGSVFIHEFAHVITARKLGVEVSRVELMPFGGVASMSDEMFNKPYKELQVSMAGPICNFILILAALGLWNNNIIPGNLIPFFIQCNLIIACFNLLPAFPLDGGRVYRAFLASRVGLAEATRVAAVQGQRWAVFLFVLGFFGIYLGVTGIDISLVALFLFYASTREKRAVPYLLMKHLVRKKEELLEGHILPVRIMVSLDSVPLSKIIKDFLPQKYHFVMVMDSNGEIKGRATESQIVDKVLEGNLELPVGQLR
ncbi:MAG: M50 family metallopeptidase [Clostridiales bacterium]|nr:M50 family metallopeptidase [Clostridiales bacterium]MCF8022285.1 M50 family metallopeptidase [Clostridiales bacterium]